MRLKKIIPAELKKNIIASIKAGTPPGVIKKDISEVLGISTRRAHEYYKHVQETSDKAVSEVTNTEAKSSEVIKNKEEKAWAESLLFESNYV